MDAHKPRPLVLLAVLGASLLLAEGVARVVVPKISKIESRVVKESQASRRLLAQADTPRRVLFAGNSLLLDSTEPERLIQRMSTGGWTASRLTIEQSAYMDWYHGLRHQFQKHGRPDAVVLMMSPTQFMSTSARGSYSAYHLLGPTESLRYGLQAGRHPTEVTGMMFGSLAAYYGLHTELRQVALAKIIPGMDALADRIEAAAVTRRKSAEIPPTDEQLGQRVSALQDLCRSGGVRCLFVLPPASQPSAWQDRLATQAQAGGLHTRELLSTTQFAPTDYRADGYHMSSAGAARYTNELADRVLGVLNAKP